MADSIDNIIKLKKIEEPVEFKLIKQFVEEKFGIVPKLQASKNQITIFIPSAAMAGNLRFDLHLLQKNVQQKLSIRIG